LKFGKLPYGIIRQTKSSLANGSHRQRVVRMINHDIGAKRSRRHYCNAHIDVDGTKERLNDLQQCQICTGVSDDVRIKTVGITAAANNALA